MSDSKHDELKFCNDRSTATTKIPILDLTTDPESDSDLPTIVTKPTKNDLSQTRYTVTRMSSKLKRDMSTTNKDEGSDSSKVGSSKDKKENKLSKKRRPRPKIEDILGTAALLDQTSDFAGGFTPYKALAEKRPVRGKRHEVSVNKSQRSSKPDKCQSQDRPLKPQNRAQGSRPLQEEKTHNVQENIVLTNIAPVALTQVKQIEGLHCDNGEKNTRQVETERKSVSDEEVDKKTCNVCGQQIQTEDADHLSKCLQGHFKFKSSSRKTNRENAEKEKAEVKLSTDATEYVFCQVCQEDITRLSAAGRTDHVNACVDGVPTAPTAETTPPTSCHICNRDLTQFNSRRRLQHVNFCADKAEKQRKEQEVALKNAREKVLDCPLCGKPLQTLSSRRNHMKQCARVLGVAPGLLQERIRQQQEEYDLQLAAGALPPPKKVSRPRKPRRRAPPDSSNGRSAPVRHLDADTELAIALSTSLAEQQRLEAGIAGVPNSIPDVGPPETNAFQVLMTPKLAKTSKRGRKNKVPDHVPQLLLQSREDLQRHLASRMELLFSQQSITRDIQSTPPMKSTAANNRSRGILTEGTYQIVDESPWWTLTKLVVDQRGQELEDVADKENVNDVFYVQQLMPPVTVSQRKPRVPPRLTATHSSTPDSSRDVSTSQPDLQPDSCMNKSSNETLVATTQTAVYLAELAAEAGNSTLNNTTVLEPAHGTTVMEASLLDLDSRSRRRSSATPDACSPSAHETSGFVVSNARTDGPEVGHDETSCLIEQLRAMVNNPVMSDFQIKVQDGSIFGHKFMIAARCPHLLKELKNTSTISLTEYDTNTVIAVLTYIYTGAIHNTSAQVAKVAAQWNIAGLLRRLKQPPADTDRETGIAETSQSNLEDILKHVWGSDYEDSDSESSSQVLEPNEEDIDNACKFVLSQRRMSQRKDETEEADTESEEEQEDSPYNLLNKTSADVLNELAKLDEHSLDSSGDEHVPYCTRSTSGSSESLDEDVGTSDSCLTVPHPENKGVPQSQRVYRSDNSLKPPTVDSESDEMQEVTYGKVPKQLEERTLLDTDNTFNAVSAQSDISADHHDMAPEVIEGHTQAAGKVKVEVPPVSKVAEAGSSPITVDKVLTDEVDVLDLTLGLDDVDSDSALYRKKESSNCDSKTLAETAAATVKTPNVSRWNQSEMSTPDLFAGSPQTPRSVEQEPRDCVSEGPSRTPRSDTSDVDLFEVGSSYSDEDLAPKMALSPIFKKTILNEPNTSFNEDYLDADRNERGTNDCMVQRQFNSAPSVSKRKRSPSVSSEDETSLSQRKKKSRLGSISNLSVGSPSSVCLVESDSGAADAGDYGSGPSDDYTIGPGDDLTKSPSDDYGRGPSDDHTSSPSDDHRRGASDDHIRSPSDDHTRGPKDDYLRSPSVSPLGSPRPGASADTDRKGVVHSISSDSELDMTLLQVDDHTAPIDLTQGEEHCATKAAIGGADSDGKSTSDHNMSLPNPASPNNVPEEEHGSVADVWSDFDDVGYADDFLIPCTQGSQKSAGGHVESPQYNSGPSNAATVPEADLEYDPPTDMESDVSMLEEGPSTSHSAPKANYVTPKPPRARCKHLPAAAPSPFTPMADYENMVTPDIKKACLQYGVRAMPKKRMVKLLKSIYESTHQYETDSELEQSFETTQSSHTSRESRETITTTRVPPPGMTSVSGAASATQDADTLRHHEKTSESDEDTNTLSTQAAPPEPTYTNAEDSDDLPEESFLGTQLEPTSPPDKRTKDKPTSTEAKREKIRSHILGDDDLYLKILHYEPLEFDAYRQELKELGVTVGSQILMDFLDEQFQSTARMLRTDFRRM